MKIIAAVILTSIGFSTAAHAEALSGPDIKKLIGGKHVYLSTPYGLEFPLYYQSGGKVSGDASGFSMASMIAPKESGKWWVKSDNLCQQWPTWYDGKAFCFTIEQTGDTTIKWVRDDGTKGTARIAN